LDYKALDELARALAPAGVTKRVKRGDRLCSFGEAASGVFVILHGTARAVLPGELGNELICRTAGPGALLGLPDALCSTSYQFDVEALETVEAAFLTTERVNEILRRHPELCMQAMDMMCDELSALWRTTEHMRNCRKKSCSLNGFCAQTDTAL
jgi:CRP-like cAMP-binding protein